MTREYRLLTPDQVELTFELAGLGSRFVAMLLDSLIQFGAIAFLIGTLVLGTLALGASFEVLYRGRGASWIIAALALLVFAVWGGYFLFFEVTRNGQTPGKKIVGIRVIRDTGHPVDFRGAFLRNVVRLVDWMPSFYGIGIIAIFASPQYRRLGDYVAGTLVVRTGRQHEGARSSRTPQEENPPPHSTPTAEPALPMEALPHLSDITRDDYRAIRHFLDRRGELEEGVVRSLAGKLAAPIAAKLQMELASVEDPIHFLESVRREWERRMVH